MPENELYSIYSEISDMRRFLGDISHYLEKTADMSYCKLRLEEARIIDEARQHGFEKYKFRLKAIKDVAQSLGFESLVTEDMLGE